MPRHVFWGWHSVTVARTYGNLPMISLKSVDLFCRPHGRGLLRVGRVSVDTRRCLMGPTGAYWGLLMPTVMSVSIWLPVPSGPFACCCLDRHCVLPVF